MRNRNIVVVAVSLLAGALLAVPVGPSGAYPRPGWTELVTLDENGNQAHGLSARTPGASLNFGDHLCPGSDLNADGRYVVFSSSAALVEEDTNLACDIYLYDRAKKKVARVSVATDGSQALPGGKDVLDRMTSMRPSISANGQLVVFQSIAGNLVGGDTNLSWDTFVHDRRTSTTTRVSLSSEEQQAPVATCTPLCTTPRYASSISANGRFVAFTSEAQNMAEGDDDNSSDVFVRDLRKGRTVMVASPCDACWNEAPSLSANGQFVVYTGGQKNVYVHDLRTGEERTATLLIDGSDPGPVDGDTDTLAEGGRQISDDGRFVVFVSNVEKFVPSDTNWDLCQAGNLRGSMPDVFVRDLKTGRTERVSVDSTGAEGALGGGAGNTGGSCSGIHSGASISGDGRFVSFHSLTNFSPRDGGGSCPYSGTINCSIGPGDNDAFVYDRDTGALNWISSAPDAGDTTNETPTYACPASDSYSSALSESGRYAAFSSCADNLIRNDENEESDVFVRDLGTHRWAGLGGRPPGPEQEEGVICISQICIPPLGTFGRTDPTLDVGDVLSAGGADLIGARLAYRPQYGDIFVFQELKDLPSLAPHRAGGSVMTSPFVYGLRLVAGDRRYEVRASSLLGGTFGLFRCVKDWQVSCSKVAELRGGFGTTGERIVFSLPLGQIGLSEGGRLAGVEVYTGIGTYAAGTSKVLDRVRIRPR